MRWTRVVAMAMVLTGAASCAGAPVAPAAPASYGTTLWAERPVVELAFDVAPGLDRVAGRETVRFTPDAPICELVFRAWPNNPTMSATGASLVVDRATVDGAGVTPRVEAAGAPAGAPGTLVELPLPQCADPGRTVTAALDFTLTLGADADERVGHSPSTETAWFGSGFPLLAWERGRGWARDDAVTINGETATSEAFRLTDLTVTAPEGYRVSGVGRPESPDSATVHRFSADAVRDVTVGVGRYDLLERDVDGVALHVATPSAGTRTDPERWAEETASALGRLTALFGPYPYEDLWVTVTPGQSDGTEFPTALQFGDVRQRELAGLVPHELAHQWFYALVGNNQARDPWLDESLATYGEALAGGDLDYYRDPGTSSRVDGRMGEPMSYWAENGGFDRYTSAVYDQGASTLLAVRDRVGAEAFDEAVRGYVRANAHRVATPTDLAAALQAFPEAVEILNRAGAVRE